MKKIKYTGSNVTVMVSSMAKAVKFYTETLGLKLTVRAVAIDDDWSALRFRRVEFVKK
jgi:catechol 2,3-dioxygenase-like lactoylglutathione lyase family enzyme